MFRRGVDFWRTPIEFLKGVGPNRADWLKKELDIHEYQDLLNFFPFRYIDRSKITRITEFQQEGVWVQVCGQITYSELSGEGRSKRLISHLQDGTGEMKLIWFQGLVPMEKWLREGGRFLVYGKLSRFNGIWTIHHPEMDKLQQDTLSDLPAFIPVYPSTEKLKSRWLSGRNFAKLTQQLLQQVLPGHLPEIMPENILSKYRMMPREQAYRQIHYPDALHLMEEARFRLKFEELFIQQIRIGKLKMERRRDPGLKFLKVGDFFNTFYHQHLPFMLTDDQKQVIREIRQDTQSGYQMNRLLQGDVGSGKTIVALLCMLLAADNGFQSCLMAPTEILAYQHFLNLRELLEPLQLPIAYLSGKVKGKERKKILEQLVTHQLFLIVGTHALIEEEVVFAKLGLCIIDEQHRFGVEQRARLWKRYSHKPHVLVMTATPIPRTLAMTVYGDLDVSVIKQLPPGRKPIITQHRNEIHRARIMDFIRQEIQQGRQIYIVYPLIEESSKLDYENLEAGYQQVRQYFPEPNYHVAMVHGRQKAEEREMNMNAFVKGKAHILVATTVIEVGVNVPNASVMLIESAERFGLSQLHQLRGRVGRGAEKSYCILLSTSKINPHSLQRLKIMEEENSGFAIAERDLELRGPGDLEGTRQSGSLELRLADIVKDKAILEQAREAALNLLDVDANLSLPENQVLRNFIASQQDQDNWRVVS